MSSARSFRTSTLTLGLTLLGTATLFCQSGGNQPLYLEASRPISKRVEDLLNRMTLKEKVGQLNLPCVYVDELGKAIPEKMEA
ncbi:MAG: beta-glucosidase, partial [Terriglobia bacterium]